MERNAQATEPRRQSTLKALMNSPAMDKAEEDVELLGGAAVEGGDCAPTGVRVAGTKVATTGLFDAVVGRAREGTEGIGLGVELALGIAVGNASLLDGITRVAPT